MLGIMMFSMRLYACFCAAFIVVPIPTTISTTPDVPVTTHSLLICLTSSMWTPSRLGFLKMITASFDVFANVSGSVYGKGGTMMSFALIEERKEQVAKTTVRFAMR